MFGTYKYVSNQEPSLTAGLQGFQGYGGLGIRQEALQTAGASGEEMDLLYDNRLVHTHRSWAEADPGLLQADQVLSQLSCGSPLAERSPSCPSSNMSESGHDFGGACALSSNQHHPGLMVDRSAHSASHLNHPAHSQWKWELASPTTANPAPGTSPLSNVSGASVVPVPQAAAVPAAHAYMLPFNNSYQPQQSAMPAVHNSIQQPQQQTTMPVVRPNSTTGESMLAPSQLSPEEEQQLLDILLPLADPLNLHLPEHQQQHQQQQFMMMPQLPTLQLSVPKRVPRLSVPQQPKQRAPRQLPAKWQAVPLHRELHVHIPKLPQSPHKPQPRPPQPKLQEQVTQPLSSGEAPQPKKRGRPPLTPGTYSRGYLAIKAYRQRKKGMVSWAAQHTLFLHCIAHICTDLQDGVQMHGCQDSLALGTGRTCVAYSNAEVGRLTGSHQHRLAAVQHNCFVAASQSARQSHGGVVSGNNSPAGSVLVLLSVA